jgi:recombination protein RecR
LDVISIERTGAYQGLYHVLGGVIFGNTDNKNLKISELLNRIKKESVQEIILATNPTTEGDATALYIKRKIRDSNLNIKITRLAKGIATGGDIEYADEATLSAALTNRRELI